MILAGSGAGDLTCVKLTAPQSWGKRELYFRVPMV